MIANRCGREFVQAIVPLMSDHDCATLLRTLREQWPPPLLAGLLRSPDPDVVKTAAVCLGMAGDLRHCAALARILHDPSEDVAAFAEQALWQLWMNSGSPTGNRRLTRAIHLIGRERVADAQAVLSALVAREPQFAEAHHQLAITFCLLDRVEEAVPHFRRAIMLCPLHFAAIVGLGHAYVQLGQPDAALRQYRRALRVHPRLTGLDELIERLKSSDPPLHTC